MSLDDIQAVIDSAKGRGTESLERLVRLRWPDATEAEVEDAVSVAVEIIESVPVFLARARQEAEERHLESVVNPVLDHATRYFLRPLDLMPEATQGLAGLVDDTYLVLRVLQNLDRGPEPFLDWDLTHPSRFLRGLVGEEVGRRLDGLSITAMQEVSDSFTALFHRMAAKA
ncbi:MAG: hypothetical protein KY453_08860 [Gemmatimonadetes bacterium]|nr:hypothetical protein [Gemmatimonadota bacterium]